MRPDAVLRFLAGHVCSPSLPFSRELSEATYVMLGAPLDVTPLVRRGTASAPSAIRMAMCNMETYDRRLDLDVDDIPLHDAGDLNLPVEVSAALRIIEEAVESIASSNMVPLILGGEHTITLGIVKGLLRTFKDLSVVVFDSHLDLRDEYPSGSKYSHATVSRRLAELLGPERVVIIGAHAFSREELVWAQKVGLRILFSESSEHDITKALDALGGKPVHLSIDVDVLDPSVVPGVSYPEPGGVSLKTLLDLITVTIRRLNVVSLDIVELVPEQDSSEVSPYYAAKILLHALYTHYYYHHLSREVKA